MTYHGTFLFPETGASSTGRLSVQEGRIVAFEETDAQADDVTLSGIITPGLIDAHVHLLLDGSADPVGTLTRSSPVERVLYAQTHLEQHLAAGITTVRDLGGPDNIAIQLAKAVASGNLRGPRILSAGRNITMTGGHGHAFGHEADGPDAVRAAARAELKSGAQLLKFMATGGVMTQGVKAGAEAFSEAELRAGIEEAHKAGKRTAAHAQGLNGIKNALRAGIDTIEHGAFDRWDEDALGLMQGRWLVPTLAAPDGILSGKDKLPAWVLEKTEPIAERHRATTTEAYRAGVRIVSGTDAGTPFNPHGDLARELELLASVGLSLLDVLRSATSQAASALDLEGRIGTLNPGAQADLVAWDGNPLEDLSSYRRPQAVIVAGHMISPAISGS